MTEITNKHLFITMLIIGFITIALLLSGYRTAPYSYSYGNGVPFQASVYDSSDYYYPTNSSRLFTLGTRSQAYIPVITKTYTKPTIYTTPTTTSYYTYTTTTDNTSYDGGYYYNTDGYTPPGCESGTDYSLTTGEPCG